MFPTPTSESNVCQRARVVYEEHIRPLVETGHMHEYIAIEPDTGEYAIAENLGAAIDQLKQKRPDAVTCLLRIGHKAAITGLRGRPAHKGEEPSVSGSLDYDIFWNRSQAIYDAEIRPWVEKPYEGMFLALHPDTRDCEVHDDLLAAVAKLGQRLPGAPFYVLQVGRDDSVIGIVRESGKL